MRVNKEKKSYMTNSFDIEWILKKNLKNKNPILKWFKMAGVCNFKRNESMNNYLKTKQTPLMLPIAWTIQLFKNNLFESEGKINSMSLIWLLLLLLL